MVSKDYTLIPLKFNSKKLLKSGSWKTTFLLGPGDFSGAMLNFRRAPEKRWLKKKSFPIKGPVTSGAGC